MKKPTIRRPVENSPPDWRGYKGLQKRVPACGTSLAAYATWWAARSRERSRLLPGRFFDAEGSIRAVRNHCLTWLKTELGAVDLHRNNVRFK